MTSFNFTEKHVYYRKKILKTKEIINDSESMKIIRMREDFLLYSNSRSSAYVMTYVITE